MKIKLFTRKSDELYYRQQGIERFIDAQKTDYKIALAEIERGRKQSHWIWYIFPQLVGLGRSCYSTLYGIRSRGEAEEYLQNEVLEHRLREITNALLKHNDKSAEEIFGGLDAMKVRSSMTLFDAISPDDIFAQVLDTFYDGKRCEFTLSAIADKTLQERRLFDDSFAVNEVSISRSVFQGLEIMRFITEDAALAVS